VYGVGHLNRSRETVWMAAVLACGEAAVLSHRSAGAAWGICTSSGRPEVTVPRQRRSRSGIELHRGRLRADETTVLDNLPVTTVLRTLLDLAATLSQRQLERAINEAEIKRLWDELSLHDLLHRYPRRKGSRNLRAALSKHSEGATATKSDLEELFLAFADRAGLPRPETNVYVERIEVDCVWRAQRVIIEVDSWEIHRTRAAFERDREKSRILQAAGWRCVPITYLQLKHASGAVARDVRRLLAA
jgi:very-short-patch-repair endonuclease